jgi:septum formation protein
VPLILASRSPRRAQILRAAGYRFTVRAPRIEESLRSGESCADAAERLAVEKAMDVAGRCRGARVLGADTIVVVDGVALGKPADPADARRMLRALSGRSHRVITGLALWDPRGATALSDRSSTFVTFKKLARRDIDWYVTMGNPLDKAGAYGIQEGAGLFVTGIRGSYTNVVGLPLELVYRMLGLPD